MTYSIFPHQINVANYFNSNETDTLLVFHGVGSGKTLTSILAAEIYQKKTGKKIVYVSSAELIENYKQELKKFGKKLKIEFADYNRLTYDPDFNNKMIIIDEFQKLSSGMIQGISPGASKILTFLKIAQNTKIMILTATPIYTNIFDLSLLTNVLLKTWNVLPRNGAEFVSRHINPLTRKPMGMDRVIRQLRGKVSYFPGISDPAVFPRVSKINIVETSNKIASVYRRLEPIGKALIYSTNIEKYEPELIERGAFRIMTMKELATFNNDPKLRVGYLYPHMSEGISVFNVTSMHVLEPQAQYAKIIQIFGRGTRIGSHSNLPLEWRAMNRYLYVRSRGILFGGEDVQNHNLMIDNEILYDNFNSVYLKAATSLEYLNGEK